MKKRTIEKNIQGLRAEYAFDYTKAKPNRFAARMKGAVAVVLAPDVAKVFDSADKVNEFLRSAISATARS